MNNKDVVRIAAVGDTHCRKTSQGELRPFFSQMAEQADIMVLVGDLTDYGLPEEAHIFAKEISVVKCPIVAVLGNHDFESGKQDEVKSILQEVGITVLDGEVCEFMGVGFAGTKGFAGGFGRFALGPWGESAIKGFVQEAVTEAMKLESALARLRTENRVALLHYSPVQATVEGEPTEIFAYLGTSRLEEPLLRHPVHAVFHGHAHNGSLEGTTSNGIPVYNVAMPLLRKKFKDGPFFRVMELPVNPVAAEVA